MVTATLSYRSGNTKFYIAEPKTPLENKLQHKSCTVENYSFQTQQTRRTKTVGVTTTMGHPKKKINSKDIVELSATVENPDDQS